MKMTEVNAVVRANFGVAMRCQRSNYVCVGGDALGEEDGYGACHDAF